MYHPTNYYAARQAAINEALAEQRQAVPYSPSARPTAPSSYEALAVCGEKIEVQLSEAFGDLAGTMVEATICYYESRWNYLVVFELDGRKYFASVWMYDKANDVYNFALSVRAVL